MILRGLLLAAVAILSWINAFPQLDKQATNAFLKRIVKSKSGSFLTEYIPAENGSDVFELESKKGKIMLRGNNGLSIASALNFYLRNYCHVLFSWNDTLANIPTVLPSVDRLDGIERN